MVKKYFIRFCIAALVLAIGWYLNPRGQLRKVASTSEVLNLTEGQMNKWRLIESFAIMENFESISLSSEYFQTICSEAKSIEVSFAALNVAYDGEIPTIRHLMSCGYILSLADKTNLVTDKNLFRKMTRATSLDLAGHSLSSENLFSSEAFPLRWKISEIKVDSASKFTITDLEIVRVLNRSFEFELID